MQKVKKYGYCPHEHMFPILDVVYLDLAAWGQLTMFHCYVCLFETPMF